MDSFFSPSIHTWSILLLKIIMSNWLGNTRQLSTPIPRNGNRLIKLWNRVKLTMKILPNQMHQMYDVWSIESEAKKKTKKKQKTKLHLTIMTSRMTIDINMGFLSINGWEGSFCSILTNYTIESFLTSRYFSLFFSVYSLWTLNMLDSFCGLYTLSRVPITENCWMHLWLQIAVKNRIKKSL